MKNLIFFLLGLIIVSCTEDTPTLEDRVSGEILPYFERFATEGSARGMEIDWLNEEISASLVDIEEDAVGQCLTYRNGSRQINVDEEYWMKSTDLEKEFLIFHELGHCLLERSHLDSRSSDGNCTSIMSSGEGLCRKNYNVFTRAEYLDELFF